MPGGWWLKYSPEFRAQALERLKGCDSVSGLARELKISRKWLYLWRERARATEDAQTVEDREKERLRKRVAELEQLVGRQTAEIDFFKGALRKVEERRQNNGGTGVALHCPRLPGQLVTELVTEIRPALEFGGCELAFMQA